MTKEFLTMDDFNFRGKRVLVRLGIDSPYDKKKGKIVDNERLEQSALVLKELSEKGAMVVGFGHQSRPGKEDFTTTEEHAKILSKHSGKKVKYINDIHGSRAIKEIRSLKPGEIILLENVRFSKDEVLELSPQEHSRSKMVKDLEPLFDYYVDNAFSNLHRPHASMTGFIHILNIAGRLVIRELEEARKAREHAKKPYIYILGGVKVADYLDLIEVSLSEKGADKILLAGSIGNLFLLAKGIELGKTREFLESNKENQESLPRIKKLVKKFPDNFILPIDFLVDKNGKPTLVKIKDLPSPYLIKDIGPETIKLFSQEIKRARTIYMKGALGVYEEPKFSKGSKAIIKAVSKSSGYTLIGGGSASDMVSKFSNRKNFSHVSIGGGVLLKFLAGKKLPGLEALRESKRRTGK